MSPEAAVFVTWLGGTVAIALGSILLMRKVGAAIWFFSPLVSFFAAWTLAFGLRPLLRLWLGFGYDLQAIDTSNFIQAQVLGAVATCCFVVGCLLPASPKLRAKATAPVASEVTLARATAAVCFLFSALAAALFLVLVWRVGALTMDFRVNRVLYLESLIGGGYFFALSTISRSLLTAGAACTIWSGRFGVLGWTAMAAFIVGKTFVSERSVVASTIFMLVLVVFLRMIRRGRQPSAAKAAAVLGALVVVGVGLGLARGGVSDNYEQALAAPVFFLTETYDMSEMLEHSLANIKQPLGGLSLVEDIAITFVPRAFFPDKPTVYGTTRLQVMAAPGLTPEGESFVATFPVGIFGEGYANFGIFGIFLMLFIAGYTTRLIYNRCLALASEDSPRGLSIFFLVIYTSMCADTLGYMRGFGQFVATAIFIAAVFSVLWVLARSLAAYLVGQTLPHRQPATEQ